MRFEFDAAKSAANKLKHGIDFVEAQALWADPDRLETPGSNGRRAPVSSHWPHRRHDVVGLYHLSP
jgi:uncharacterized DUF497 family protein